MSNKLKELQKKYSDLAFFERENTFSNEINHQDKLEKILSEFVNAQVGLDVGFYIVRHNNKSIDINTKHAGDASEWVGVDQELIDILKNKGFGDYETVYLTSRGFGLEKI